jgi:hypothetical protein
MTMFGAAHFSIKTYSSLQPTATDASHTNSMLCCRKSTVWALHSLVHKCAYPLLSTLGRDHSNFMIGMGHHLVKISWMITSD